MCNLRASNNEPLCDCVVATVFVTVAEASVEGTINGAEVISTTDTAGYEAGITSRNNSSEVAHMFSRLSKIEASSILMFGSSSTRVSVSTSSGASI